MRAALRTLIVSLLKGFFLNFICFSVSAFFSLVVIGIGHKVKIQNVLSVDNITAIKISAIICSAIIGAIVLLASIGDDGEPSKYWVRRVYAKKPAVKFHLIILTILPHVAFSVIGFLFLNNWGSSLVKFSEFISEDKFALVLAHILNWTSTMLVSQLAYSIASFIKFKKAECRKCKNVYSYRWDDLGEDKEESTENKKVVETKVDYYAGEGIFKGSVRKNYYDEVVDRKVYVTTTYKKYRCTCCYCGNQIEKRILKGTEKH